MPDLFDISAHPRGRHGRFIAVLGRLADGGHVDTTDGIRVERVNRNRFHVHLPTRAGGTPRMARRSSAREAVALAVEASARSTHPRSLGGPTRHDGEHAANVAGAPTEREYSRLSREYRRIRDKSSPQATALRARMQQVFAGLPEREPVGDLWGHIEQLVRGMQPAAGMASPSRENPLLAAVHAGHQVRTPVGDVDFEHVEGMWVATLPGWGAPGPHVILGQSEQELADRLLVELTLRARSMDRAGAASPTRPDALNAVTRLPSSPTTQRDRVIASLARSPQEPVLHHRDRVAQGPVGVGKAAMSPPRPATVGPFFNRRNNRWTVIHNSASGGSIRQEHFHSEAEARRSIGLTGGDDHPVSARSGRGMGSPDRGPSVAGVTVTPEGIREAALRANADFPEDLDAIRAGRPVVTAVVVPPERGGRIRVVITPGIVDAEGGLWASTLEPETKYLRWFDGRLSVQETARRGLSYLGLKNLPVELHLKSPRRETVVVPPR